MIRTRWGLTLAAALAALAVDAPARAQAFVFPGVRPPRRTFGTYGPRMSFGEFGYRMNYGYAFGNPYGGLGSLNFGFGSGLGPQFGPRGALIYSSAYTTPGVPPGSGYYPPFAAYGWTFQNPAVFPPGSPNYGGPGRLYPPPAFYPPRPR
jgi:hypothetical protein